MNFIISSSLNSNLKFTDDNKKVMIITTAHVHEIFNRLSMNNKTGQILI